MAQVKITALQDAPTPNSATIIPCVSGGTTRKLTLSTLKNFLEIPTEFVTLVIAESPITVSPSDGIRGEGSVGILEASSSNRGTMSSLHYSTLNEATDLPNPSRLVMRTSNGDFQARNITLRAAGVEGTAASGTLTGNLNQRLSTDTGVNAKLGEQTRYSAKVTTLDVNDAANFSSTADFTSGPVRIGNTPVKVTINGDGTSSFSGNMTVGGNLTLTAGRLEGPVNTGATAFSGKFTDLTVNSGLTASGSSHTINGATNLNGNLTFDNNRAVSVPGGSATLNVGNTAISSTGITSGTFTGNLTGNCSGSATSLATSRTIALAGSVTGSAQFNGTSDITITTAVVGGSLSGSALSAGSVSDDKLATISTAGKVANSATTATTQNTANTIVLRDSSGGFNAGTITGSLNGNASSASSLSSDALAANYTWTGNHVWSMTGSGSNGEGGAESKFVFANDSSGGESWITFRGGGTYWNLGGEASQFYLSQGGGAKVFVDTSGDMTVANNITAFSDERLKENWKPLCQEFVKKLSETKAGTFDRIDTGKRQVGVSAQDLAKVLPEAVLEGSDGYLSVAYGHAALTACVELAKEVVSLRKELLELKAGNNGS